VKKSVPSFVSGLLFIVGSIAGAQVGHNPATSPYVDLEHAQELSLLVGQFHGHRDAVNVGPQSGLLYGLHYEFRAGGPAYLTGEVARIQSDRNVINPFLISGKGRELGNRSQPLYSADVGLGIGLTGGKSWHHIVPELAGGIGLISDFRTSPDTGGYKFGTRFALTWGGGIRVVPGGKWQVRLDAKNRMYTIGYPEAFYVAPAGGSAVVPTTQSKSFWLNNPAFTLGISRLF
jgi:hypothetical protein